jgi:hypothetical protein
MAPGGIEGEFDQVVLNTPGVLGNLDNSTVFDLTGDAAVDPRDLNVFLSFVRSPVGDADLSGIVDLLDFNALKGNFGSVGPWTHGDFDVNDVVDLVDFNLLKQNFGTIYETATAVPEPSSLALQLLGSLMLLCLISRGGVCRHRQFSIATRGSKTSAGVR